MNRKFAAIFAVLIFTAPMAWAQHTFTTVAGTGTAGFSGEGGPATSAQLDGPTDVFVDGHGNIFIADANNNVIREIVAATGNINTVAGMPGLVGYTGDGILATTAELNGPTGVTVDGSGNIFIAEINGSRNTRTSANWELRLQRERHRSQHRQVKWPERGRPRFDGQPLSCGPRQLLRPESRNHRADHGCGRHLYGAPRPGRG